MKYGIEEGKIQKLSLCNRIESSAGGRGEITSPPFPILRDPPAQLKSFERSRYLSSLAFVIDLAGAGIHRLLVPSIQEAVTPGLKIATSSIKLNV